MINILIRMLIVNIVNVITRITIKPNTNVAGSLYDSCVYIVVTLGFLYARKMHITLSIYAKLLTHTVYSDPCLKLRGTHFYAQIPLSLGILVRRLYSLDRP